MEQLRDTVALITGAGAGIGKATAKLFAQQGSKVVITDIRSEAVNTAVREIEDAGGQALGVPCDVTNEKEVIRAVEAAHERFGQINTLFNCAGGSREDDGPITEIDIMSAWRSTMELNMLSMLFFCKYALPHIVRAGGGTVINMSSAAALRGASPYHVYTAAKGAVISLTRALAGTHAKDNIRVNAICAGRVQTESNVVKYGPDGLGGGAMTDRQNAATRIQEYPFWKGEMSDIASIALFLASPQSRMITGAAIQADGGRSAY